MSFYIIGTAGHIDHGKTELSKALTGINTDRLSEEQERGMSIKLGFAPFSLTDDIKLGLVDVPGHEKFISQMMSGASGMDIVILVIAATEGIMPQTKEHLSIISILGIKNIIVALTKISLVEEEMIEFIKEDISEYLKSFNYNDIPIVPVDSITKEGLDDLKNALKAEIEKLPERSLGNYPRLPVDRVFSLTGHGTIVTGTLWSGKIKKGDYLVVFPINKRVKIRNIQVHGKDVDEAVAGQRVALNIPEAKKSDIPSGAVILKENLIKGNYKVTGSFRLLPEKGYLGNNSKIRVHLGTEETLGKLILLEDDEIWEKEEQVAGLYLDKPLGTLPLDILIIRNENNTNTLGSFKVIDNEPSKLKRKDKSFIEEIYNKLSFKKENRINDTIKKNPFISKKELLLKLSLSEEEFNKENSIDIININDYYILKEDLLKVRDNVVSYLKDRLSLDPLLLGIPKEEIKSKFFRDLNQKVFNLVLEFLSDSIELNKNLIFPKDYIFNIPEKDKILLEKIYNQYKKDGFLTKNPKEVKELFKLNEGDTLKYINYLINDNRLIKIDENIYFTKDNYDFALKKIIKYCKSNGSIDIGGVKELLGTTRKYIVPLLEYLDYNKITKRIENKRVLLRR